MILATTLVASLRISEAITESTGILVNKFKVGIFWDYETLFARTFPGAKVKRSSGNGWFLVTWTFVLVKGIL